MGDRDLVLTFIDIEQLVSGHDSLPFENVTLNETPRK